MRAARDGRGHIQTCQQPLNDKMVFMDFMGKSWRYGGITRPDIIFNIIYIMRTKVDRHSKTLFLLATPHYNGFVNDLC